MKNTARVRMLSLIAIAALFLAPGCAPPVEGRVYEFYGGNVTQKIRPGEIADCELPAQTITLGGIEEIDEATFYKIDPPILDWGDECIRDKPTFISRMSVMIESEAVSTPSRAER